MLKNLQNTTTDYFFATSCIRLRIPELTQQQNVDPTYQQHDISRHHQDLLLSYTSQPPKASTLS